MTTKKIKRIQTEEDFMLQAFSCDSAKELPTLSSSDRFFYDMYMELLESIYYHFKQFTFLYYLEEFSWRNMKTVEEQFEPEFDALKRGLPYIDKYIKAHLNSIKETDVSGAVYVLSSLDNKYLDLVLEQFMAVEKDYIPAYVKGLKHGRNIKLTDKLLNLIESCSDLIKSACFEIIKYRDDCSSEQIAQYKKQLDPVGELPAMEISQDTSDRKTLTQLIKEMEAEQNSYETRKTAWQEFIIRTKQKIAFEPDWPVKKQEKAIEMCKQAMD